MELLTLDTVETNMGKNTTRIGTSILADSQPEQEIKKVNKGAIDGKDFQDKEVKNSIGKCEYQSHNDKHLWKAETVVAEETVGKHFGEDEVEKDNGDLETNPVIKLELCEEPLEVIDTVSHKETTNNANDDCGDLIAKDMLSFAWQIARGMVSSEWLLLQDLIDGLM